MTDDPNQRHPQSEPPRDREAQRRKALDFFKEKGDRKTAIFQQMETERAIGDAKTAKLRALRLAKEDADREAARIAQDGKPAAVKKKKPIVIHTK
jgi:hypothetical protein